MRDAAGVQAAREEGWVCEGGGVSGGVGEGPSTATAPPARDQDIPSLLGCGPAPASRLQLFQSDDTPASAPVKREFKGLGAASSPAPAAAAAPAPKAKSSEGGFDLDPRSVALPGRHCITRRHPARSLKH